VAAGLVASLLALTGCALPASEAAPAPAPTSTTTTTWTLEPTTTTSSTTTTTVAPATTFTAAATQQPSELLRTLGVTWSKTPASSCLMVSEGSRVVFERNPDAPVAPASTMKLLTATAVLQRIDPTTRLVTPVVATAAPDATGTVAGDLWLVGGGDPVLGTSAYRAHFTRQPRLVNGIETLADRLVAAGLRHVTGRVVGDDGRYERRRYGATWPARYVTDNETGPLSALAVNDGFERWDPDVPFKDPAAGAAGVLEELLRQRGVTVDGLPASGSAPQGAVEVASLGSPSIGELVGQMLLDSDNDTAELLLRELGLRVLGQGTTDAGRRVAIDTLTRLGLPMRGIRMVDGSGLDPSDRVTCRLMVALVTTGPARTTISSAVPVAARTGTLYKRFLRTPVAGRLRAKTGSIKGVASLVGWVDSTAGHTYTFAYVENGVTSSQGSHLQDEVGTDLVLAAP
jgi:D-alanyl-D-alanine carboxypeptidase/D-alanyl-D-alanine-endopeptidase (penicillin-binding protein 4)